MSRFRLTARTRADLVVHHVDQARCLHRWTYRGRRIAWVTFELRRYRPELFEALRHALATGQVTWKGQSRRRADERRYVSDRVDAARMAVNHLLGVDR